MRRAPILFAMTVIAVTLAVEARAEDRYGPPLAAGANANTPEPVQTLTWPGKTAAVAPAPPQRPDAARAAPQPARPASLYDPPPPRWRAAETASTPAAPAPAPLAPTRPFAAQSVAAQPAATKAADGAPPHFYSLARQYGVEPDPIALSPQFLAASPQADMAEPPPLPPPHTIGAQSANMSTAAATSQVRQAQEAAADADAATLGN